MPDNLPPYLFALSAGFVYTISALLAKRGLELGAGTFRSLVYSNWVMALFFIPYPMLADVPLGMEDLKAGGMIGILFFAAQSCCFIALRSGDASMVTPIMGSKSVFVALFLLILNLSPTPLGPATWAAAILAAIAVALIGWPAQGSKPSLTGLGFALATAAGFGLVDSLVPHFSHLSDPFNVLFSMFATVGLLSFLLIPLSKGKFLAFRGGADRWMWASCFPMGAQAVLMSLAIGFHHVPTEANVFYSCRGLWAILLVAWLGKRMGLKKEPHPKEHKSETARCLSSARRHILGPSWGVLTDMVTLFLPTERISILSLAMKTTSFLILLLTCLGFIAWSAPRSQTKAVKDPNVATKDPDFAIQGEYAATSEIGHKGKKGQYGLQVVALGDGNFQAALYKGGLPGSGAENNEFVLLTGSTEAGKTTLKAKSGETVIIKGDTATGTKGDKKLFAYDRVERKSPTLGKKAPKGAKVLFAGVEMDRFSGGPPTATSSRKGRFA